MKLSGNLPQKSFYRETSLDKKSSKHISARTWLVLVTDVTEVEGKVMKEALGSPKEGRSQHGWNQGALYSEGR